MPEPDRPDLEFRLSRPDWWLRQPLAGLWLHPWFDGLSLYTIGHWYLVLSRAWAAALVAEGDVDRFWQALPGAPSPVPGLGRALRLARQRAQDYDALERAWLEALFQDGTDEAGRLALTRRRARGGTADAGAPSLRATGLGAPRAAGQVGHFPARGGQGGARRASTVPPPHSPRRP